MDIEEYNNFYHVDLAVQIDNNWNEDTALGIVKDSRKFSIKIKGRDKEIIKRRFISIENSRSAKRHNRRVIILIYCYLLYKAICDFPEANPLLLCRDVRPEPIVVNYLRKVANFFGSSQILDREIKFRKREDRRDKKLPKSLAGKYVRKVFRGQVKPDKILDESEINKLIEIISKEI